MVYTIDDFLFSSCSIFSSPSPPWKSGRQHSTSFRFIQTVRSQDATLFSHIWVMFSVCLVALISTLKYIYSVIVMHLNGFCSSSSPLFLNVNNHGFQADFLHRCVHVFCCRQQMAGNNHFKVWILFTSPFCWSPFWKQGVGTSIRQVWTRSQAGWRMARRPCPSGSFCLRHSGLCFDFIS